MDQIIIAIDGFSSTGKSTIAKQLAKELSYIYVDTGAMYRAVTLYAMQQKYISDIHFNATDLIADLPKISLSFIFNESLGFAEMILNGVNVEKEIRSIEVSRLVSKVAAISEVRKKLVSEQQEMGKNKGIVMDGRDIGTVVFPDAELKLFMTASADKRATRRYKELLDRGDKVNYEEIVQRSEEIPENKTEDQTDPYFLSYLLETPEEDAMDLKSSANQQSFQSYDDMEPKDEQKFKKIIQITALLLMISKSHSALAIWFEATGQAVIHNGEKAAARQQTTQEAIKQALLFSGASVTSIQSLVNGLLEDDRFEIRASGEVSNIELIDEIYHDDYVTVSIRADIFPQQALCAAADYKKNIVTTWYNINKRQQAAVGNLYDFGRVLAEKLQVETQKYGKHAVIHSVEPYYLTSPDKEKKSAAYSLARKTNAQYVLFGEIVEFQSRPEGVGSLRMLELMMERRYDAIVDEERSWQSFNFADQKVLDFFEDK